FTFQGHRLFVIGNHFISKGGDQPLYGHFQPPVRSSEVQRHKQAQLVNDFVDQIVGADASADVVVLGDLNDFQFSETLSVVEGGGPVTATVDGISIDKTKPVISYTGNAGTYAADEFVHISCLAADGLSDVASTTCSDIDGPAYTFGLGTHPFSAMAIDNAGN